MAKDKLQKLTFRQEQFAREFIKDFVASAAAIRAGYSEQTARKVGYQLLMKPHIAAKIDELQGERIKRTKIDSDEILRRLMRIADRTEQDGDYNAALRSLELLGKNLAMWTDKNISEVTYKNPFSSGQDEEAIQRDAERMADVIRAGKEKTTVLGVIEGGKKEKA
jgi:phage terminase small subunit